MTSELSESRRKILEVVKQQSAASIRDVARVLGVTHEAARKQIVELQRSGWLTTTCADNEEDAPGAGRPSAQYCLTRAGENLFPKRYASLTAALLDRYGEEALAMIADETVRRLNAQAKGSSLEQRVAAAREVYFDDDPYTTVEQRDRDVVLVERNCPFIDVAMDRPAICSTTVSALRRFTGREVVRERRFQDGDGRCEFHVRAARRARHTRFEIEPPRSDGKS
jgi:predicted ArsR family transcriptional regulator